MSNYDPFRIYARSHKASNKGQVLRKKYYPFLGNTFTQSDIQRVIDSLEQRGYNIFPPGAFPPSSHETIFHDTVGVLSIGQITFPSNSSSPLSFLFSTLWDIIEPEFAPILNVSPDSISNFEFRIDIISINSWGNILCSSSTSTFPISLYFKDEAKSITFMPSIYIHSNDDYHISVQSLNSSIVLNFTSVNKQDSFEDQIPKKEGLDTSYLMGYLETNPSLITALKDKDYSSFNPILYNFSYTPPPSNVGFPNNSVTFHIHLQYDIL